MKKYTVVLDIIVVADVVFSSELFSPAHQFWRHV